MNYPTGRVFDNVEIRTGVSLSSMLFLTLLNTIECLNLTPLYVVIIGNNIRPKTTLPSRVDLKDA